jgi:hypothetical protein
LGLGLGLGFRVWVRARLRARLRLRARVRVEGWVEGRGSVRVEGVHLGGGGAGSVKRQAAEGLR